MLDFITQHFKFNSKNKQVAPLSEEQRASLPATQTKIELNTFTIVSACYNVSSYLDDFLNSLVNQDIGFEQHIYCVLVDDGSTDDTWERLQEWQAKYPNNIKCVHKENGGQSSARNVGLQYVTTPWVTFTDPDDILESQYFTAINDSLVVANAPIVMVGTNLIFYREEQQQYSDTHSLNFKFQHGDQILPIRKLGRNIQLSMASALFLTEVIKNLNLTIDERIKPNFEDGHFIVHYLAENADDAVLYCANAKYYYRKRADHSSTVDSAWKDKRHYLDIFKYGYLDVLTRYSTLSFVQNTILYDLSWFFKTLVNNPERAPIMSNDEQKEHIDLLRQCFSYIDVQTILKCSMLRFWMYDKVGVLNFTKNIPDIATVLKQRVYIEDFDPYKKEIKVRYFSGQANIIRFFINNFEVTPTHYKRVRDDYLGQTYCYQHIYWVPIIRRHKKVLTCTINNQRVDLVLASKAKGSIAVKDIFRAFADIRPQFSQEAPWLILDREIQADDNAEHLYRWIKQNHPERKIYFGLNKNSHDWKRLKDEGFNLLALGGLQHKLALRKISKIISSHIEPFVINYFHDRSSDNKQIIFLQHGVTKDDLSRWLNGKKRLDLFVTTTSDEYQSIIGDDVRYRMTDKEVQLIGFPRHDALLTTQQHNKVIVIMPTWRNNLMGKIIFGNLREKNPDFMTSLYAQSWSAILQSPQLEALAKTYGYKVIFFPHSNIQPYLEDFKVPDYIVIKHHSDGSIQELFKQASLMITDYSSVAFEFAFCQKPVLYYQFDADTFFNGETQVYQKGYFTYAENGFGPVVYDEASLFQELEKLLSHDCVPSEPYLSRITNTFKFRDGKNCARVYEAICALDKPYPDDYINPHVLEVAAFDAVATNSWKMAKQRFTKYEAVVQNDLAKAMLLICDIQINLQPTKATLASLAVFDFTEIDELVTQLQALTLPAQYNKYKTLTLLEYKLAKMNQAEIQQQMPEIL